MRKQRKIKDLQGKEFGALTVVEYSHKRLRYHYWMTECREGHRKALRGSSLHDRYKCSSCIPIGNQHSEWEGCGELSKNLYNVFRHSATWKKLPFEVSIEYLWDLFVAQDRKCAFTGEELYFNKSYKTQKDRTASPDRIDSTKGYIEGNLQWVHRDVNKLKKNMTDARFIEICIKVAEHQKNLQL